jgi:hypothetical protein
MYCDRGAVSDTAPYRLRIVTEGQCVTERMRVEFLIPCVMLSSSHYPSRVYHPNKLSEGILVVGVGLENFC